MAVKIDRRLNLVIPLYGEDDQVTGYVHSTPISREAFDANFLLISKTFALIHAEGLGSISGPRVAVNLMREIAKRSSDDPDELCAPLMNEIRRLSNFIGAGANGWEPLPLYNAIRENKIDVDDLVEVESAIVFFTCYSAMLQRRVLADMLVPAVRLWGAQTSSLTVTAFAASLPTSTPAANTGVTVVASSAPS